MPNFFYFDRTGNKQGPVSAEQLKELATQGVIDANTPMETDTGHKGLAGQIPGLFATPPPVPQPAVPAPVHQAMPQSAIAPVAGKSKSSMWITLVGILVIACVGYAGWKTISGVGVGEAAKQKQCSNNLQWIVLALHNYRDVNNELPPLYTVDNTGKPLHSWRVLILPYLEHAELYDKIRLDEPWDSEHNKQFYNRMPPIYQCPSNPGKGCCYVAVEGILTPRIGTSLASFSGGSSNTLALVEVRESFNWMDPEADIALSELEKGINAGGQAGSHHTGGMNAAFLDSSIRFFDNDTPPSALVGLGSRD